MELSRRRSLFYIIMVVHCIESGFSDTTPEQGILEVSTVDTTVGPQLVTEGDTTMSSGTGNSTTNSDDANYSESPVEYDAQSDENGTAKDGHKILAGYVTVPVLLVIGLFGNFMSIVFMTRQEFSKMPMRIIIIALAISDTIVIIMHPHNKPYVRSFLGADVRSYNVTSCKVFYWFFRTAKMTSSWLIVLISMERFVAVWFPLKAKFINTRRNIFIGNYYMILYCQRHFFCFKLIIKVAAQT